MGHESRKVSRPKVSRSKSLFNDKSCLDTETDFFALKRSKKIMNTNQNSRPAGSSEIKVNLTRFQYVYEKFLPYIEVYDKDGFTCECPTFSAEATLIIPPLPVSGHIMVGWVNVCSNHDTFYNHGNEGVTCLELPELLHRAWINDSNADSFPWFNEETVVLKGPINEHKTIKIYMDKKPQLHANWYIPNGGVVKRPTLTFVYTNQKYQSYLYLMDVPSGKGYIIREVSWSFEIAASVDPKNDIKNRAKIIGPCEQDVPKVFTEENVKNFKPEEFNTPTVDQNQMLVWRSIYKKERLLVEPSSTGVDLNMYLTGTRHKTLDEENKSKWSFLMNQKKKMNSGGY